MVELLFISPKELENKSELEKLTLIAHYLGDIGLDPPGLLYCGIEGTPLLEGGELRDRRMTFATSHRKMMEAAREIDTTGHTSDAWYPLKYAFKPQVAIPALITYDRSQMIPEHPEEDDNQDWLEEWTHKNEIFVRNAANSIVLFSER